MHEMVTSEIEGAGVPVGLLSCRGVCFSYGGREVLHGADLDLGPGQVLGVIGPNGAGKSTLLRLAAGIVRPSSGEVLIDGRSSRTLGPREVARCVAYVPQGLSLPFPFRVLEVVLQGRHPHLGALSFETSRDLEIAHAVMERTGVWGLRDRSFDALSGGERQRVVIAAALAQEPRLLVLDEPTSALDLRFQGALVRLVRELARDQDLAVLVALHDLDLASVLCDELILLVEGEIRGGGSPDRVLNKKLLEAAYETPLHVARGPGGSIHVLPIP
jgi:iron complex transport system ATP-binding protein